jgi:hypothetical protein
MTRSPTDPVESSGDILLCAKGPSAESFLALLGASHRSSIRAESAEAAAAAVRAGSPLAIVDFDSLEADKEQYWVGVRAANPHQPVLVVSSARKPADAGELFIRYRVTNLLARNGQIHSGDFARTIEKILGGELFGIDKYLAPGTLLMTRPIVGSRQKDELLDLVERTLTRAGVRRRLVDNLLSATDEMVSNAVYDAPVDAHGQPRYARLPRTTPVSLEPHEYAQLTFGADATRFAISVADPFGTLSVERVLDYLGKCFGRGASQIDPKEGGAGLGLYMMFNSLSHFVINVATGHRTEVIGIMDLTPTYREFAERSKSFNVFVSG